MPPQLFDFTEKFAVCVVQLNECYAHVLHNSPRKFEPLAQNLYAGQDRARVRRHKTTLDWCWLSSRDAKLKRCDQRHKYFPKTRCAHSKSPYALRFIAFFRCFNARFLGTSFSGLGGVFTAAFSAAMKRRCASGLVYLSASDFVMITRPKNLVFTDEFLIDFGQFHGSWLTIDMMVSFGIGKFLKIPHESTHILTSGMEFGRKATILRNLVYRSADPRKKQIVQCLGRLQNDSKRNVFSHAVLTSDVKEVTFIDRTRGGDYVATEHTFTKEQFTDHVAEVMALGVQLEKALALDASEFHAFAMAALKANTKPTKSPVPPSSKA